MSVKSDLAAVFVEEYFSMKVYAELGMRSEEIDCYQMEAFIIIRKEIAAYNKRERERK